MLYKVFRYRLLHILLGLGLGGSASLLGPPQESSVSSESSSRTRGKNTLKEMQKFLKEVREAKQHLKKNQEQLDRILKRLQSYDVPLPSVQEEQKFDKSSPLLTHLEFFSFQLKRVLHNFFSRI